MGDLTPVEPNEETAPDHAPLLERLFDRVPEPADTRLVPSEGTIPPWLRGSYYANGPARFRRGDQAYRHWLDGDGFVMALHFDGEEPGPRYVARFIESTKWTREESEGRACFRTFGTCFPGDELLRGVALASPVNVSIYPHGGKLLAFGEQGLPWELDPVTLETLGEHTFDRRLNPVSPFSAHPSFDLTGGEMVNFGLSFAVDQPTLNLYRFAFGGHLVSRSRIPLPYPASIHDFGLTKRYAVFYVNPYMMEMAPLMEQGASVLDCLTWEPDGGSMLLVVDWKSGECLASIFLERGDQSSGYCLHHINAFEYGSDLVVDVLELDEPVYPDYQPVPDLFVDVAPAQPVRYRVNVASDRVVERRVIPYALAADFPALAPGPSARPKDSFWMLAISKTGQPGRKFFDRLVRMDLEKGAEADAWQPEPGRYLGNEPVVVGPGSRDESGELMVLVHELDPVNRASAMVLLDAWDLAAGPKVRLPLPGAVAPLFHACFAVG